MVKTSKTSLVLLNDMSKFIYLTRILFMVLKPLLKDKSQFRSDLIWVNLTIGTRANGIEVTFLNSWGYNLILLANNITNSCWRRVQLCIEPLKELPVEEIQLKYKEFHCF